MRRSDNMIKKQRFIAVTRLMHELGIPPHIMGYYYIRDAVLMVLEDKSCLTRFHAKLYPVLAETHNTVDKNVHRNIVTAIKKAWNGDNTILHEWFEYKPGNTEFIAALADMIRVEEVGA
jgi:two-component system response regulator (stage 0 sporulation protein A)